MIRWMMMCSFMLLVYGCGPLPSSQFETSQLALDVDINIDVDLEETKFVICLLYTSPSPRDGLLSRMPSSA